MMAGCASASTTMSMSASTYQLTSRPFLVQLLTILSLRPYRSVLAKNQILKMRRWRPCERAISNVASAT